MLAVTLIDGNSPVQRSGRRVLASPAAIRRINDVGHMQILSLRVDCIGALHVCPERYSREPEGTTSRYGRARHRSSPDHRKPARYCEKQEAPKRDSSDPL